MSLSLTRVLQASWIRIDFQFLQLLPQTPFWSLCYRWPPACGTAGGTPAESVLWYRFEPWDGKRWMKTVIFIKLSGGVSKRKTTVLSVLMSFHREDKKQPKLCGCDRPSADDHQTLTWSCSYLMSSSLKWNSTVTQDSEEFQVRLCRWLWGKTLMSQPEKKNPKQINDVIFNWQQVNFFRLSLFSVLL